MLADHAGVDVGERMYLLRLHPDQRGAELVKCTNLRGEARAILDAEYEDEGLRECDDAPRPRDGAGGAGGPAGLGDDPPMLTNLLTRAFSAPSGAPPLKRASRLSSDGMEGALSSDGTEGASKRARQ